MSDQFIRYSVNLNCRDKSLKVVQYGCRLLMGYYGSSLTPKGMEKLRATLTTTLLIRRASRLFIFLSNLYNLVIKLRKLTKRNAVEEGQLINRESRALVSSFENEVVETVEIFEQLFWALFFVFDTYIGFVRLGAVTADEQELLKMMEAVYFPLWFAPDFCVFWKTIFRLYHNNHRCYIVNQETLSLQPDLSASALSPSGARRSKDSDESERLTELKSRLWAEKKCLYWTLTKSIMDMGVSASFIPRTGVKKVLGEGFVGAFGMASAIMAVIDEINKK